MPVYAYRCANCGASFERYQTFEDASLKTCPECHKKTLKKVISTVQVVFKGSGFYSTDNKSSSGLDKPKPAKKEDGKKDESKTSDKKDEGKKETAKEGASKEDKSTQKSEKAEKSAEKE